MQRKPCEENQGLLNSPGGGGVPLAHSGFQFMGIKFMCSKDLYFEGNISPLSFSETLSNSLLGEAFAPFIRHCKG